MILRSHYGALLTLLIFAFAWSSEALAFHCRTNGVLSGGGDIRIDVNIGPDLQDGKNTFIDLTTQIKCWNDGGVDDYLSSDPGRIQLNKLVFADVSGGVTINNVDYNIPVSEVSIMSLSQWQNGEIYAKKLPMKMYFTLDKKLGKQLSIKKGDLLGSLGFIMRNGRGDKYTYTWSVYAKNNTNLNTSICTITAGDPININFGSVDRMDIPTSGGTEETKALTLACTGPTAHDFSVKLNMTAVSWSTSQLVTSNPDLGVQVTVGGVATKLGDSFAMKVPGATSKTLGFSLLRNPKTSASAIATGDFTASGTLVVSEQ